MRRGSSKLKERGMEENVMVVDGVEADGMVVEDMVEEEEEAEVVEVKTGVEEVHGIDDIGNKPPGA